MRHRHAELMLQYAQDAMETDKPWERWEYMPEGELNGRSLTTHPKWLLIHEYRRKPKTININGFEVPEPVREPLKLGQKYYIPSFDELSENGVDRLYWRGDKFDNIYLKNGMIHVEEGNAILHKEALLSFTITKKVEK